jgi:hypothetical protein
MRPNLRRSPRQRGTRDDKLNLRANHLIQRYYFHIILFRNWLLQEKLPHRYMLLRTSRYLVIFDFAGRKMPFACVSRFGYLADSQCSGDGRAAQLRAVAQVCHLNLTHCGDTKSSMRRDVSCMR